jgi:hypothetical protein
MLSLVAFNLVHDVMCQQFQTEPLRREPDAPRLRWRLSFASWTRPMANGLRAAAEYLEGLDAPSGVCLSS